MLLLLAALCGLIEAVFTALEVALGAVSRARLRALTEFEGAPTDEGAPSPAQVRRARQVLRLLEHPDRLSILFLSVTSLSLWSAASLLTWHVLAGQWSWPVLVGALVALLFVAEVVPLLLAAPRAEGIALRGAGFILGAARLLWPLTFPLGALSYGLARLLGSGTRATPHVTEGELRTALAAAEAEGAIESGERALIEGAMDLRTQTVRQVMTPRLDIMGLPADSTLHDALHLALREGHSRMPVYDGTLDKIVGVLATKDLLPHLDESGVSSSRTVRDVVRPALFFPESGRVSVALDELRRNRTLLAIVVDSNGGTAGLVTLEDLLEELVGEIQDEYDAEEAPIRLLESGPEGETVVLCQAGSSVRELGRFLGAELGLTTTLRDAEGVPVGSGTSLAALFIERFGRVPLVGDSVLVGLSALSAPRSGADGAREVTAEERAEWNVWLEVAGMDGPRLTLLRASLKPEAASSS
jgi:putative hemolysin